jgi:hypothetical protein
MISAGSAFRLIIFGFFFLQHRAVRRVLLSRGASETLSSGVACLMIWTIYPFTNLYSRGALTEFFAVSSLTLALCCLFDLFNAKDRREEILRAFQLGFCAMLFVGTHPITALYGITFLVFAFGLLSIEAGWKEARRNAVLLIIPALLALIVISPWVYAVLQFSSDTLLASTWGGGMRFEHTFDWIATRFFPIPFDVRMLHDGPATIPTPYLDAQANVPLLILAIVATWRDGKSRLTVWGGWLLFSSLRGCR